jgi:hypothetical protein
MSGRDGRIRDLSLETRRYTGEQCCLDSTAQATMLRRQHTVQPGLQAGDFGLVEPIFRPP